MDKQKAINFLYKDWQDNMQFDIKESFIEYLEREVIEAGMQEYIKIQQASSSKQQALTNKNK